MFDKPLTPGLQLLIFLFLYLICSAMGSLAAAAVLSLIVSPDLEAINWEDPTVFLTTVFFTQAFGFILAFFVFLRVTGQKFREIVQVQKLLSIKAVLVTLLVCVAAIGVMLLLANVNELLWDWFSGGGYIESEEEIMRAQEKALIHDSFPRLLITLVVLGLLPAIAEELVFRGVLMGRLLQASEGKVHFSVIVSSLIFAGLHFQPSKLLPIIFLATCLGYIYHYFKDIRYSILLHFLINGSQIVWYFAMVNAAETGF